MIITPYSRRLRVFGVLAVFILIAIYLHIRPAWRQRSYDYAREFSVTVSNYLAGNGDVYNNTLYQEGNKGSVVQYHNFSDPCADFPSMDGIQVVMKTGATEAFDKIPTHLLTTLQCVPDFLLFSDMEQQIGKHHIYDVLSEVEESTKAHNNDFDLYRDQKECPVSQKSCVDVRSEGQKAWNLDKYKFLPMMEQTWRMRPGRDWYVFAEADTYVFWKNMVEWLRKEGGLNPKERLYIGSRSYINGSPFGHGGSGYVLSGTLLRHLIEQHQGVVSQYGQKGSTECCGDLLLALALQEYEDVTLRQAWPMFNGEKPSTLPYGPGHWCEPILTMHHMNAEEISSVWQFEQTRKTDRTLLIRDLYEGLIAPKMQVLREHWDNLSDDVCYINPDPAVQAEADDHMKERQKDEKDMNAVEKEAWKSAEHCSRVCASQDVSDDDDEDGWTMHIHTYPRGASEDLNDKGKTEDVRDLREKEMLERKKNRSCFQYRYQNQQCCTSKSFKLGTPKPKSSELATKWVSGWDLKGINDWISATGDCKQAEWKTPEL